jgi:hypothetical protein
MPLFNLSLFGRAAGQEDRFSRVNVEPPEGAVSAVLILHRMARTPMDVPHPRMVVRKGTHHDTAGGFIDPLQARFMRAAGPLRAVPISDGKRPLKELKAQKAF